MNIVVIARTRDEARNIEKFCSSYSWADHIIISDGGSTDATVQLAMQFENVTIKRFTERVSQDGGKTWRNPHGRHINFMIREAKKLGADWIIFDDVDCFPTKQLMECGRDLFSSIDADVVQINRIYAYGRDKYFKQHTIPFGDWESSTSLYAWRPPSGVCAEESDPWNHTMVIPPESKIHHFAPPIAAIHDYYPEGEIRQQKVQFYRDVGEQPGCQDPMNYAGDIIDMEDWMKIL